MRSYLPLRLLWSLWEAHRYIKINIDWSNWHIQQATLHGLVLINTPIVFTSTLIHILSSQVHDADIHIVALKFVLYFILYYVTCDLSFVSDQVQALLDHGFYKWGSPLLSSLSARAVQVLLLFTFFLFNLLCKPILVLILPPCVCWVAKIKQGSTLPR